MDNFMDRLMARFNSVDLIKANTMAEKEISYDDISRDEYSSAPSSNNDEILAELKKLSAKNEMLEKCLKAVNDKNAILMEAVKNLSEKNNAIMQALSITNEKSAIVMEALVESEKRQAAMFDELNKSNAKNTEVMNAISGMIEEIAVADDQGDTIASDFSAMQQDIANSNRSIKKVITDLATVFSTVNKVQSKVTESQEKFDRFATETQEKVVTSLSASQEKLDKSIADTQEFMHKESVKVYRNVQAMVEEENTKLVTNIGEKIEESKNGKFKVKGGSLFGVLLAANTVIAVVNLVLLLNEYVRILPF